MQYIVRNYSCNKIKFVTDFVIIHQNMQSSKNRSGACTCLCAAVSLGGCSVADNRALIGFAIIEVNCENGIVLASDMCLF